MASRKERHKRVISKDNDDCQPPAKRKKGVPEDQLKLERVLKCASSDTTILEKAKTNLKSRGGATSQQSNGKHSRAAVGPSKGTVSEKKSGAQKAVESNRIEEKRSKSISQKVKEKTIESPKTQSSQKNNRKNPKESEYFKKEKPVSGTTSKVSKVKEESKPEQKKPKVHDKKQIKRDSVSSSPSGSTKSSAKQKPPANIEAGSKKKSQSVKQEGDKKEKSLKCVKEEKPAKIVAPKVGRKRKNATENQISNVKRESPKKEPAYSSTSSPIMQQMIKQEDDSDSDESDWEEVEENVSPEMSQVPSEPVTITLKGPDIMNRKKKKVPTATLR